MDLDLDPPPPLSGPPPPHVRHQSPLITPAFKKLNFGMGMMLKELLSVPLAWFWVTCIAVAMSSTSKIGLLVAAQSTSTGGSNETLSVLDSRIKYQPALGRWQRQSFTGSSGSAVDYVSINELVLEDNGDGTLLISPKVTVTFQGSALHYLTPTFPFNSSVGFSVDNRPQQYISLFDNSTARPGVNVGPGTGPSGVRTFVLAERLEASTAHTLVLSSHAEDDISFMYVGQLILTTSGSSTASAPTSMGTSGTSETAVAASSSSGKKLKIILPVTIIGSLIVIGVVGGLLFCHLRGKKTARGTAGQTGWGWDATPITAPAAAFARRFSRHGSAPPPPRIMPFSPGSEESALKDPDDFEEYVEATAFKRKPSAVATHDMPVISKSNNYSERMQSFGSTNEANTYVPARLTQENLQQLANNGVPPPANPKPPPIVISQRQRGRDHRSVVSAANTAELLVRDIPYLPYLHTVAQPSENSHSRESQPQIHAPVPLVPQRRSNQTGSLESAARPHQSTIRSDVSHGTKTSASPGLYPTYFPSGDPTAAAIIERGEQDVMLPPQKIFKPSRQRSSGESSSAEASNQGHGSTRSSHASQPPAPPPKPQPTNHPVGGRRPNSLRRKAVPTIQELEASSTSTVDRQERPPSTPPIIAPSSTQSHSRVTSDSSARPRPLPQTPTSPASTPEGSTAHHSSPTRVRHASPPPSSYHASSGHDFYGASNSGSSSRQHEQRPAAGRSPKGARSSGGSSRHGKERERFDPVWYPDRTGNVAPPQDDFDDIYVDEEVPQASPSRAFGQGSSSR